MGTMDAYRHTEACQAACLTYVGARDALKKVEASDDDVSFMEYQNLRNTVDATRTLYQKKGTQCTKNNPRTENMTKQSALATPSESSVNVPAKTVGTRVEQSVSAISVYVGEGL